MKERSAHRYKIAIFALTLFAVAATFAFAVRYWLPAWGPTVAFSVLGAGPLVFWATIGAIVFDPTQATDGIVSKASPDLGRRLTLALTPVFVCALVGVGLSSLWFADSVRLLATEFSVSQRLSGTLDAALRDDSSAVRLAACNGLAEIGEQRSPALFGALVDASPEVVSCALAALPRYEEAPLQLEALANRWQDQLLSAEAGPGAGERACMLADRVRIAARKGASRGGMYLLRCALQAQSAPAQECCGQAFRALLGGNDVEPSMVMMPPAELVLAGFHEAVPELLRTVHADDAVAEQRRAELRLGSPRSSAWALSIGCETLHVAGAMWREPISTAMAQAVSSDACHLAPATERTVRLWTAVCSEVFTAAAIEEADGTEGTRFCRGVSAALMLDATTDARQEVHSAIRLGRTPNSRAEMLRALLSYSSVVATKAGTTRKKTPSSSHPFMSLLLSPKDDTAARVERMMRIFGGAPVSKKDGEEPGAFLERYVREDQKRFEKAAEEGVPEVGVAASPILAPIPTVSPPE